MEAGSEEDADVWVDAAHAALDSKSQRRDGRGGWGGGGIEGGGLKSEEERTPCFPVMQKTPPEFVFVLAVGILGRQTALITSGGQRDSVSGSWMPAGTGGLCESVCVCLCILTEACMHLCMCAVSSSLQPCSAFLKSCLNTAGSRFKRGICFGGCVGMPLTPSNLTENPVWLRLFLTLIGSLVG